MNSYITTIQIITTNNIPAAYLESAACISKKTMEGLATTVEYASYGTMMVSMLPCKIVGLELMGVMQLAFLSIGNMDEVNTMLTPFMAMKGVQGLTLDLS